MRAHTGQQEIEIDLDEKKIKTQIETLLGQIHSEETKLAKMPLKLKHPVHIVLETQEDVDQMYSFFQYLKMMDKLDFNETKNINEYLYKLTMPWREMIKAVVRNDQFKEVLNLLNQEYYNGLRRAGKRVPGEVGMRERMRQSKH